MQLLRPFEIDDRHDADLEVGVAGDIDLVGHDGAVQALIEQQVGIGRQLLPVREGPGGTPSTAASFSSWT